MEYHNTTREQEMSMKPHYNPKPNLHKPSLHNNSHTISKFKPKIRIIHIIAPEIIKTDAANFRELVQRLTGKPSEQIDNFLATKKKFVAKNIAHNININNNSTTTTNNNVLNSFYHHVHNNQRQDTRFFPCGGFMDDDYEYHATARDGFKVEDEAEAIWGGVESIETQAHDSILRGFTELDDFIQEMAEYPLLPY